MQQGSDEWLEARRGHFTASEFSKIITPTGLKSKSVDGLVYKKVAELLLGRPVGGFSGNYATERGLELEPQAKANYEFLTGQAVQECGFILAPCGYYGATPDGLVGDNGLLEVKSVNEISHVENMLNDRVMPGDKPFQEAFREYYPQLQGQLLVTGRKWVDWMSFHPEMLPVIIRVNRDEPYIEKLESYLAEAKALLDSSIEKLKERGYHAG